MSDLDISLLSEQEASEAALAGIIGANTGLTLATLPSAAEIAEQYDGKSVEWGEQYRALLMHCHNAEKGSTEPPLDRFLAADV